MMSAGAFYEERHPFYNPNHYHPPRKGEKRRRTGKIAANRAKAKAARQARKR